MNGKNKDDQIVLVAIPKCRDLFPKMFSFQLISINVRIQKRSSSFQIMLYGVHSLSLTSEAILNRIYAAKHFSATVNYSLESLRP